MAVVDVYNLQNEKVSELELKDEVFAVPVKPHVLHQVVVGQLHGRRSGNAFAKGRSDVKSSGSKLWRQKGTGRARVGDAASPIRRGGGKAFGPAPRKFTDKVPKKVKKAALRMVLSDKARSDQLTVVNEFTLPEIKTRDFVGVMNRFDVRKALIVTGEMNDSLDKSSRNVPWVKVMNCRGLNVYDLLKYDHLFLDPPAIEKIQEALVV
ncbi:MAG: 50S ribosomal protein L4 [Deltaproteobacteria bacterium]|nr:50S ribosomal protein L4 [Deltaproteobacteria bacterium]MBW2284040.1 50S ribosomal protein L4 [Deltaproteobacteria bacterium]